VEEYDIDIFGEWLHKYIPFPGWESSFYEKQLYSRITGWLIDNFLFIPDTPMFRALSIRDAWKDLFEISDQDIPFPSSEPHEFLRV
jgi:hypothetical protein